MTRVDVPVRVQERAGPRSAWIGSALVSALTLLALAVNGYHPWVEDGGLYAAGVKWLLAPQLYPQQTGFVTEHQRFSLFAPLLAGVARATHLPLPWVLLLLYCGCIWATLCAGWMLAGQCFAGMRARCGAVALLACWLPLPLAGTSLMLMDPYVTARSFSTPLSLLALCWALDGLSGRRKAWLKCGVALLAAFVLHPLMAGYGVLSVAALVCVSLRRRVWACAGLCCAGLLVGLAVQVYAAKESPDYLRVVLTRGYWFPGRWEWYELVGLVAPLAILAAMLRWPNRVVRLPAYRQIAQMAVALGVVAMVMAAVYSRVGLATHAVARLQPLRTYQAVYCVMILLLGAAIAEYLLQAKALRWVAFLVLASAPMWLAQRSIFPASNHLEMPWIAPRNQWVQAFLWIRQNTPETALFAMDPHYTTADGEDAQVFRAIAERSSLPDYAKDGGETSITPQLTGAWVAGQEAQAGIDRESDAERLAKLGPIGVDWVVLPSASATGFACPYRNDVVKVCRLR